MYKRILSFTGSGFLYHTSGIIMAAISLALRPASTWDEETPPETLEDRGALGLPRVHLIERQSSGLHPSPFVDQPDVLSLNLTRGCVHRCPFCSVRAHPSYVGDEAVYLFRETARRLDKDLATRRKRPRAVFISPSTDPFPPFAEIQAETAR